MSRDRGQAHAPTPLGRGRLVAALLLSALVACAQDPLASTPAKPLPPPASAAASDVTDPCAMQMHDLCGALLLYYLQHSDLPPTLQDLSAPGRDGPVGLTCPVSQRPYVYNPGGILEPQRQSRIVVYDAAPSHDGMRWAIRIREPVPGQPLVAQVVRLPESLFLLRPPAATAE